jgi:hypothetical protein
MLFMVLLALGWISLYHDRSTGSDVVGILTRLENGK